MEKIIDKFVERLKLLRTEKGITQEQLAKDTGLSQSAITYWETGKRVPNAQVVIILARYFGVTTDYLLGESNDK